MIINRSLHYTGCSANLVAAGPNMNCKIWLLLDTKFKEMRHKGLFPFRNCIIHVINNVFPTGIIALLQDLEGLAFNLQARFKPSSCKEVDFRELSNKAILKGESFVLGHVSKRWLTLNLVLGIIVERWDDGEEYFLN